MGDEEKAAQKPARDTRLQGAAGVAPSVAWLPASRLMLDIIKQG